MGPNIAYLLDPRSESCLLVYEQTAATSVDCAKIAQNVPEARAFITWVPREESDAVVPESQSEKSPGAAEEAPSPE